MIFDQEYLISNISRALPQPSVMTRDRLHRNTIFSLSYLQKNDNSI